MSKVTSSINIPQPSIFGRLGTGIGQGLAEQLPKEIERARLGSSLDQLGKQQGLDPWQQYTGLVKAAHEYPQVVQSGADILRQRGISQGFRNIAPNGASPNAQNQLGQPGQQGFNQPGMQSNAQLGGDSPQKGVATVGPTQATLHPYIPKNLQQLQGRAGQLQHEHPEIYPTADLAMKGAVQEDQQEQAINTALQGQREGEQAVQENVRSQLSALKNASNAVGVPENVYQEVENEALQDVRLGKKDELTAAKDAREKLENINREYKSLDTVGDLDYMIRDKDEIKRQLKEIRSKFKDRGDLENLADSYISKNNLSPGKAYYLAFDPSDIKPLNNLLEKLPELNPEITTKRGFSEKRINPEEAEKRTLEAAPALAQAMGKEGSPLAIAEYLASKNYDPAVWMKYVGDNRKKLDLTEVQGRQLDKTVNGPPTLNDMWLFYSSGLDKLVEQ